MGRGLGMVMFAVWSAGAGVGLAFGRWTLALPMGLLAMLALLGLATRQDREHNNKEEP